MNFKLERNFNKEVPNWDSILENYNWSLTNKKMCKHSCPGFFVSHEAHLIKEVEASLQKLNCSTNFWASSFLTRTWLEFDSTGQHIMKKTAFVKVHPCRHCDEMFCEMKQREGGVIGKGHRPSMTGCQCLVLFTFW